MCGRGAEVEARAVAKMSALSRRAVAGRPPRSRSKKAELAMLMMEGSLIV